MALLTRVLIIEDHQPTAALICAILADAAPTEPAVAHTVRDALLAIHRAPPDLVLLDLGLPDGDGISLIDRVRRDAFAKPILVITSASPDEQILGALRAGADGYLFKEELDTRLAAGLRDLADGGAPLSPRVARVALRALRTPLRPAPTTQPSAPAAKWLPAITRRELEVLELLAFGGGYAEVARALEIEINTVRTHVRALYHKLGVENRAEAVNLAWNLGLLHRSQPPPLAK